MHVRQLIPGGGLALVLALGALAGCGGKGSSGNGVAAKSPDQIAEQAKAAADSASSVHVAGAIASGGSHISLDLDLAAGKGGRGQITVDGLSAKLIVVGTTAYINGDASFYRHFGGKAAVQLFQGKWLKAPTSDENFAQLSSLADMHKFIDTALSSHGTLEKGAPTTVNGQPAIGVRDTSEGGHLYVATTGKPYPLQLAKGGAEGGKISFDHWDEPVALSAPSNAVDITELTKAGH